MRPRSSRSPLRLSQNRSFAPERPRTPPWRLLVLLTISGVVLGVLHNRWRATQMSDPALGGVRLVTTPVQQGSHSVGNTFSSWNQSLFHGFELSRENQMLRAENNALRAESEKLRADAATTARLREMLKMPSERLEKGVIANVIALLPSSYFETVTVGAGTAQGVGDGWIARTAQGLVGQVTESSLLTSQVMLLSDFNSAVSVLVRRNGKVVAGGVVRGGGRDQPLDLVFVKQEASLKEGDQVFTSGYGSVIPPDVPVGIVTAVSARRETLTKSAQVKSFSGMPGGLREVLLLPGGAVQPEIAKRKMPFPPPPSSPKRRTQP